MKFKIKRGVFQTGLSKIQGISEKRSTIPILANALLFGEGNKLYIVATDLEIGVMVIADVEEINKGELCIPARKLYDIIKELPDDEIEVQRQDNFWAMIKGGKSTFLLPGVDPRDFPSFPSTTATSAITIMSSTLIEMIEKTVFAASTEETRFNLNGVYMEKVQRDGREYLRMVATDGHRLSMIDKEQKAGIDKGIIISKRGLLELRRTMGDRELEISISIKDNNCIFKSENTIVVVRLLEGEYPDYQQVIPLENDKRVVIDRRELIGALRRAQVIASEKGEGVTFSIRKGSMQIKTGGPDVGSAHEEMSVDYAGDPIDVSFNVRYLLDVLSIMDAQKIQMELKSELSSGLIRPIDADDHIYVIMPMRL